jgi:hypothetical protein
MFIFFQSTIFHLLFFFFRWQPFNGLQVFNGKFNRSAVDESLFDDIPPKLCKKQGGAAIRIKCTDDGLPNATATDTAANSVTAPTSSPSSSLDKDIRRAKQRKPSPPYRGKSFSDMSNTLNSWLTRNKKIETTSCSEWTAQEMQQLQAMLYLLRDTSLNQIYAKVDDNRKMRSAMADIEKEWSTLNALIEQHGDTDSSMLRNIQRDGHCHEVIMWYVHHLTEDVKVMLSANQKIHLPLLSDTLHSKACDGGGGEGDDIGADAEYAAAKERVCNVYKEQVTCASCHSDVHPPGHGFLSAMGSSTDGN